MSVIVSHAGKQHSYHLAKALLDIGQLSKFYTSSYVGAAWLQRAILARQNTFWMRRFKEGLAAPYVEAHWRYELREMYVKLTKGRGAAFNESVYARDMAFDAEIAGKLGKKPGGVFWGFQGSAHSSLLAAKAAGKLAIVELATAHVTAAKHYLGEEALRMPQWADSIDNLTFSPQYEARLRAEPEVADRVVAASAFTKQTLLEAGIAASKIDVLPLGFDVGHVPYQERLVQPRNRSYRPFKLLYAGNVTQRKGMSYLLEAMKLLTGQNITLDVIGTIQGSGAAFKAEERYYNYKPAVAQHELFGLYGQYDALVLPTLFEGFGLVLVEAMAAGLPIITTAHSIGPDLVNQWANGAIVPIRDSLALAEAISHFANLEPETYLETRRAARATSLSFTWDAYADRLEPYLAGLDRINS